MIRIECGNCLGAFFVEGTVRYSKTYTPFVYVNRSLIRCQYCRMTDKLKIRGNEMLRGFDISHYQGHFNWAKAKQDGYIFGYAKATEGTTFTDSQYSTNKISAQDNGMPFGAYHFFHPNLDPMLQVEHFLKVTAINSPEVGMLPPVLDWEVTNGVRNGVQISRALTWLNAVESALKRVPMIYGSPSFLNDLHLPDTFGRFPLWVAHYGVTRPRIPHPWTKYTFWQTSDSHGLDLNQFPGSLEDLHNLLK